MSGVSKTATVIVAVFAFCLIAFAAQLFYVLWWRRRFRRQSVSASELDLFSYRGGDTAASPPPSKELLYFFLFCLENKQFRIEPATAPPLPPPLLDDVALKWPPPSRALFTIAEEREGFAADGTNDNFDPTVEMEVNEIVSLEDHFDEADQNDVGDSCGGGDDHCDYDATPFSTPCGSPPFYTPSPSPARDDVSMTSV